MAFIATSARYGTGRYGVAEYGVINISASLTGVAGTTALEPVSAGGFEIDVTERITDSTLGSTALGTIQVNTAAGLTGVVGTGAVGALEHSNTVTLTGVVGTGQVNTVLQAHLDWY